MICVDNKLYGLEMRYGILHYRPISPCLSRFGFMDTGIHTSSSLTVRQDSFQAFKSHQDYVYLVRSCLEVNPHDKGSSLAD